MFAISTVATATEALASQRSGSIGAMLQRSKKNNDRIEILHGRRRFSGLMWEETVLASSTSITKRGLEASRRLFIDEDRQFWACVVMPFRGYRDR